MKYFFLFIPILAFSNPKIENYQKEINQLKIENSKLEIPFPQFSENPEKAEESVRKLAQYSIGRILCYHSGTKEGNPSDIKREILDAVSQNK